MIISGRDQAKLDAAMPTLGDGATSLQAGITSFTDMQTLGSVVQIRFGSRPICLQMLGPAERRTSALRRPKRRKISLRR